MQPSSRLRPWTAGAVAAALVVGAIASGCRDSFHDTIPAAMVILVTSSVFTSRYTGVTGSPSEPGRALDILLATPEPERWLLDLCGSSSEVTRLYALQGLVELSSPHAEACASTLGPHHDEPVETLMGCVSGTMSVGEVVETFSPPSPGD